MNRNNIISKSIGCLLLMVMTYNFYCSAICAAGGKGCCGKEEKESCCSHEKESDEKKGDCQDIHLSFFKTLGQFSSGQIVDAPKVFHHFIAIVNTINFSEPVFSDNHSVCYTGLRPPPPKADIRIFIQSFQI